MPSGSLTVVGTGIRLGQISLEARACIECAGKVFFLVTDPLTASWIIELNPSAESLVGYYRPGKDRSISYREMVERMLTCVREGLEVCVAIYGHPGVFADPPHEAIRRARLEGYEARMLPAISAEDCLFADLGINPGRTGCQSFEATDFLVRRHRFDTRSALILWQIGATCDLRFRTTRNLSGIRILTNYLQKYYGRAHKVVLYEAAQLPLCDPILQHVPLARVPKTRFSPIATLFVPPKPSGPLNTHRIDRLGIRRASKAK